MKALVTGAIVAAVMGTATAAWAADPIVMRISHQMPPAHHIAKLVEQFAADVEERTGNKVDVQIFGSSQVFQPDQNHPAVARGQIEAAIAVNFQWGNTIPEMNVLTLPYYFTDMKRIEAFPGSEAAKFLEAKLLEKGVKNVAWFYTTRQSAFTSSNRPLVKPEDFKGVKIRGLNKLVDNALTAVGAAPAAMPGSEVYQALQTGVIDAGLTDVSAAYSRKYYEVQKYATITPFFSVYFHMYANPAWWNGLPEDVRTAIGEAAAKAERDAIPITEKSADEAIAELKAKGMQVHVHTEDEARAFREAMQAPVIEAFRKASSDAGTIIDLVDKL
ncbi:TRAP transporter substrate-binding protein DctP [Azospirillum halopraeferens]|uniref:TRAP transporter substrate-binding protein n=1 Tax=Azospirillum halopraeferens TaxID=34010 RepID=UPI0003FB41A4|nr:TRAP transporter substrate-binding protein DctP [Azospirillum halopraeferens]